MTAKLEPHEAADAFPMMESGRFEELKADIEEKGLLVPITICEGRILDGRNRYKACRELGIEPSMRTFEGDPWAYVWSMNGQRRDLVREQRYLIWKHCHERSAAWQAERERIAAEANAKRSKAADARRGKGGKLEAKPVVQQNDAPLDGESPEQRYLEWKDKHKGQQAKAAASKTNVGAVARGDKLDRERPDLAEKVRLGTLRPAEAHKQMRREERERWEKEAAAKRSKAADARRGKGGKLEAKPVVQQTVGRQAGHTPPATKAKAAASKTNPGAVARGDKLKRARPDLAEKVRLGELRPAEAHKQMRREERERWEREAAAKAKRATWTVTRAVQTGMTACQGACGGE